MLASMGIGGAIMVLMVYFNLDKERATSMVRNHPEVAERVLQDVPAQTVQQILKNNPAWQQSQQQSSTQSAPQQAATTAPTAISMSVGDLIPMLRQNEGINHSVYVDTTGNKTIGVGFNLERRDARSKISQVGANFDAVYNGQQALNDQQVDRLLQMTAEEAINQAHAFLPEINSLPKKAQLVVADMCFNLGPKINQFVKFRAALQARDYASAVREMQNSTWFRQVKSRGHRLVQMMNQAAGEAQNP